MKKIVITGGTGLIGRPLTQKLAAAGHQIIILTRRGRFEGDYAANVQFVPWDAQNIGDWAAEVDGADAIINLAAESIAGERFLPQRWTTAKKNKILQTRLNTSDVIVKAVEMAAEKPEVLLQASAIGFYGPHGDEWVTEDTPPGQDFLAQVADDWERASIKVEEMGVRRVVLRTGLVLTTEGGPLTRMMLPFKFFAGGTYGSGRQWYSWIHIEDLIDAMVFLIESQKISGPVNLVSPHPVTNKTFAKTLGRTMGRPSLIPLPSFAMRILAGEASMLVLDGQRVSSSYLQEQSFQFTFPKLELALQDLISGS